MHAIGPKYELLICGITAMICIEEFDRPAVSALGVRLPKLNNALNGQSWDGWPKPYHLDFLRASEGTLSRWSRLHLQSLAPINSHWARVVGHGPFSLLAIHKEGLCLSSGDINRLMMMYWRPIWRSGLYTRLLRKRLRVRFPYTTNIYVHDHVCLY
jgi:hypothetical protein